MSNRMFQDRLHNDRKIQSKKYFTTFLRTIPLQDKEQSFHALVVTKKSSDDPPLRQHSNSPLHWSSLVEKCLVSLAQALIQRAWDFVSQAGSTMIFKRLIAMLAESIVSLQHCQLFQIDQLNKRILAFAYSYIWLHMQPSKHISW